MAGDHLKDIFTYLVQHGADINGVDPTLGTPLMLSIREGADFRTTKWLVEMGADVTVKTPLGTALHNACKHGTIDILDFLLKHGGDKILQTVDSRDLTPLTVAADKDRKDIVKFLVKDWQVDINYLSEVNPLLMAVQKDHIDMVQLLIDLGADVNVVQPRMKCYPLHLAASNNFLDIVDLLLKNGAIVDCCDPRGYTPLFMASSEGYVSCVSSLIKAHADVNHRSMDDYTTAIYHAATANRTEIVRLLLDHDADPLSTRDEHNHTLAEIAQQKGNTNLANLLELWVSTPPDQRHKICASCNKYVEAAKRCGKCKSIWYCSQECQRKHWPKHKANCHQV